MANGGRREPEDRGCGSLRWVRCSGGLDAAAPAGAATTLRNMIVDHSGTACASINSVGAIASTVSRPGRLRRHQPVHVLLGRQHDREADRQASLGVRFLDHVEEVDAAWQSLVTLDEPRQLPDRALTWRYMVERRMFGQEFSVEALVRLARWCSRTSPGSRWWRAIVRSSSDTCCRRQSTLGWRGPSPPPCAP